MSSPHLALAVHGGAGTVPREGRAAAMAGCRRACQAGYAVLERGGSALDGVQAAVRLLEADPHFNAGTGGHLDEDGLPRQDASLMRGADLALGGVGAVLGVVHPIDLAREVLEDGRHALLVGSGALEFARARGVARRDPAGAVTPGSRRKWESWRTGRGSPSQGQTVGAVARDRQGHLAAATSTGGLTGRRRGRVGDSALAGAGTYAQDGLGAVSCTGDGEWMMRTVLAYRAAQCFRPHPHDPHDTDAVSRALAWLWSEAASQCPGYTGGVLGVGPQGPPAWIRSTPHMAVAWRHGARGGHHI